MEESERLVRYLDHLKYLDQGYVDYNQYQIDLNKKDLTKLKEFVDNLSERIVITEDDMGFQSYFARPLSINSVDLPYEQQKYIDNELAAFNKSFNSRFHES